MSGVYPEIEPYAHGMLAVGDANSVYWETCGNPRGLPAVVLHGGPGSGCSAWFRRLCDPTAYRIVLFDQRNCGRSTPHASDPRTDLSSNTTWNLVADIARLRQHVGIERWLVIGGSWGSTLALAYAERHLDHVSALLLFGVTTDPQVRQRAADACLWESATPSWPSVSVLAQRFSDPAYRLAFTRIVTHYVRNYAWIEDQSLIRGASALADTPGVLVHGRFDLGAPLANAWELHRVWPRAELVVVPGAGHEADHPGLESELVRATDRFAQIEGCG